MAEQTIRERVSQEISEGFSRAGEQFTQSLTRNFTRVTNVITRQFEDLIGPDILAIVGVINSMLTGIMGMFSSIFGTLTSILGFGKKQRKEESEQTEALNSINRHFKDEEKRRARQPDQEEGGMTIIGALAAMMGIVAGGITAITGGVLDAVLRPFRVTKDIFKGISAQILRYVPRLKILETLGRAFRPILKAVDWILDSTKILGKWLTQVSQGVGKLASRFATFAKFFGSIGRFLGPIGLFITAMMGFVDFFRGFMKEEGSLFDKIKAGFIEMVVGFFEPVLQLFGWIADKLGISEILGIKEEGELAQRAIEGFRSVVSTFFSTVGELIKSIGDLLGRVGSMFLSTFEVIWHSISGLYNLLIGDIEGAKDSFGDLIDSIKGLVKSVFNIITWPFRTFIIDPLKELISWVSGIFEDIGIGNIKDMISKALSIPGKVVDWINDKLPTWSNIKSGFEDIMETDFVGKLKDVVKSAFEIPGKVVDWIKGKIPSLNDVKDWAGDKFSFLPGIGDDKEEDKRKRDIERNTRTNPNAGYMQGPNRNQQETDLSDFKRIEIDRLKRDKEQKDKESENMRQENEKLRSEIRQLRNEQKKTGESMNAAVINTQNVQQNQGGGGRDDESPDEIENFGMVFMNKSTLGASL